jgi:hypothetical protein
MSYANTLGGTAPSEKIDAAIDDVELKTHSTIDTAAAGLAQGVDSAAYAAHDTVKNMATGARTANVKAGDAIDDVVDEGGNLAAMISDKIRDNPLTAAGAALAIGYLFARLRR